VVLHHTVTASGPFASAIVRGIQRYHQAKGWSDIGYNWLVSEDGRAFEGRGWGVQGAHAEGFNGRSVGIALLGTYSEREPTDAQRQTFAELVAAGVRLGWLAPRPAIFGHRELPKASTACPGHETSVLSFALAAARAQEGPVSEKPNAALQPNVKPLGLSPVVLPDGRVGYYILASDGSVYAFGAAPYEGRVQTSA
jgi:hypothetical protein